MAWQNLVDSGKGTFDSWKDKAVQLSAYLNV
jgi:hypothetical protein